MTSSKIPLGSWYNHITSIQRSPAGTLGLVAYPFIEIELGMLACKWTVVIVELAQSGHICRVSRPKFCPQTADSIFALPSLSVCLGPDSKAVGPICARC
jgi:hypothetical protein